jgi:predicted nucleic acid-binding protein
MILLDTSAMIGSLAGRRQSAPALRRFVADGLRLGVCTLALYEWWRGPRTPQELAHQEALFPREAAFDFGIEEAGLAAQWYRRLPRARGREMDLAIAACAVVNDASLWTLNPEDFRDVPGLTLA